MQDQLQILLDQIGIEREKYSYFNHGELKKIVGNFEKTCYKFELTFINALPPSIYEEFTNLVKETFNVFEEITFHFQILDVSEDIIKEYFQFFLQKEAVSSPRLNSILDAQIFLENNIIFVQVKNKLDCINVNSISNKIERQLNEAGFFITIQAKLNEIENEEFNKQISEELKRISEIDIPELIVEKKHKETLQKKASYKTGYKSSSLIQDIDHKNVIIGRTIDTEVTYLKNIHSPSNNVTVEAYIFADLEVRETKTNLKIVTVKFTDYTDSMYGKIFINEDHELSRIKKSLEKGKWFLFRGTVKDDLYSKELTFNIRDVNVLTKEEEIVQDTAPIKRVELHAHTMMSQMDGVADTKKLLSFVQKLGHRAIAITDHNGVQGFVEAYRFVKSFNKKVEKDEDKFKVIYGSELLMIDDRVDIVLRPNNSVLLENTYVVFDFETTGFNAGGGDSIIEIGAVKICNGEIIDTYDELINPGKPLSSKITEITQITDEMLKDKDNEENAVKRFIEWYKDFPLVAHNAKFDVSFLEMALKKYHLGSLTNPVIDTLELSRTLDHNFARHSLSALVKRYNVPWDENSHHRGDYDALGTALVFHKMMKKLFDINIEKMNDLDKLVSKDEIYKYGRGYHINVLALNKKGLKNLFKIVSMANTTYLYKTPRILRSKLEEYRDGLLIGSGCYESEVFKEARSKSDEELANIINFYDYVEVQAPECYQHLIQMSDFKNEDEVLENIRKIVRVTKAAGKIITATGDVHHLTRKDKIYREIIVNQKVPGGGRHPLAKGNIQNIPSNHFRTTDEMLQDFSFLGEEKAFEIVVSNTNKIADMVDILEVIIETNGVPFSPKIKDSVETVRELVYNKAREMYGENLPEIVSERIEQELKGIIGGGFDVIYLIAQKLVKHSNDDGYLVGSRGSVGSSLVATMMGITEVNPLPAHYMCPNCKHSIFEMNGAKLGATYSSGFDLPDMICPHCSSKMIKDGNDMPFATFLGFNADKVPDIDLNFSGDYQWKAHEYTKVLFGVDNVYRAGTIGTVAEKTAFGFVKGYCEDKGIVMRNAEIERLAIGCTGVKRTTGQHPGGIVVIPDYMDVFDFTPFQYPADAPDSPWRTTHFDYHAIEEDVLKLDILGHVDPTHLRMLQDLSGMDVTKVPLDDKDTMKIFSSPDVLGVTKEQIDCETGTLGIPEFGTPFTIGMLVDTKPTTFAELIKISGLSHGTDVWLGNAQELIRNKIVPFKNVIGCRDDIMVYLMYHGLEPIRAFKIMEFVRKGKASKDPDTWKTMEQEMKEAGIEEWFIDSCHKIKYMFPKAHATAYVTSAFRIAYFKVHHPLWYYASYFSVRCTDFDIETMIKGYDAIKSKIMEINSKGYDATNKETSIVEVLKIAQEATARGIQFVNVDILKSDSTKFIIDENKHLIPPFCSIDGLGGQVAKNIVEEREKTAFLSIEDLQKRAKISTTLIDKMRVMGLFEGWDESSQLSLF